MSTSLPVSWQEVPGMAGWRSNKVSGARGCKRGTELSGALPCFSFFHFISFPTESGHKGAREDKTGPDGGTFQATVTSLKDTFSPSGGSKRWASEKLAENC